MVLVAVLEVATLLVHLMVVVVLDLVPDLASLLHLSVAPDTVLVHLMVVPAVVSDLALAPVLVVQVTNPLPSPVTLLAVV